MNFSAERKRKAMGRTDQKGFEGKVVCVTTL